MNDIKEFFDELEMIIPERLIYSIKWNVECVIKKDNFMMFMEALNYIIVKNICLKRN